MDDRIDIDVKRSRARLMKRRRELLQMGAADTEAVKPVAVDQRSEGRLSRMDALQSQAVEMEIERRRHQELQRIESALQRIEDGEFGYCVACGDEIAVKRLENDPTTPLCINCATEA
ncbi:MAG: TraR/DksA family transcriptional regulator [Rhodospirillales bacterium]|nr:TraR/DksA family transcriptional regulator [Rhodospirillales bacterium]